ncbi:MAG: gamma-glutamylcyclotransferase [Pseudomonadota bacterium]
MADLSADANGQKRPAGVHADGRLWVFAYGSLIWRPEFPVTSSHRARVHGYHRDFCLHSVEHRGTPERSGLVLGLAPGGACLGVVFEVAADAALQAVEDLDTRELATTAYIPRTVTALTASGPVKARTYVCDRAHWQYAGRLTVAEATGRIVGAKGRYGANEDYVSQTLKALRDRGIHDARLEAIGAAVANAR